MSALVTAISGLDYLLFVFFLSEFPLDRHVFSYDKKSLSATFFAVVSFLFVPVGGLPAFTGAEYSIFYIAICFIAAVVFSEEKNFAEKLRLLCLTVVSFAFLLATSYFALEEGFPGDKFSLSLLCSVNIWKYLNFSEIICAIFTVVCFLLLAVCFGKLNSEFLSRVLVTACCAVIISFAIPFDIGNCCRLSGFMLLFANFICFCAAVYCLKFAVLKFSARQ